MLDIVDNDAIDENETALDDEVDELEVLDAQIEFDELESVVVWVERCVGMLDDEGVHRVVVEQLNDDVDDDEIEVVLVDVPPHIMDDDEVLDVLYLEVDTNE